MLSPVYLAQELFLRVRPWVLLDIRAQVVLPPAVTRGRTVTRGCGAGGSAALSGGAPLAALLADAAREVCRDHGPLLRPEFCHELAYLGVLLQAGGSRVSSGADAPLPCPAHPTPLRRAPQAAKAVSR